MPTNGSLTEKVVTDVEEILARCPDLRFGLDISLDGIVKIMTPSGRRRDCSRSVLKLTGD